MASSHGWTAATDALTRYAAARGWDCEERRAFHKAVMRVVEENGDWEFHSMFTLASELDTNCEEGFLSAEAIGYHLRRVHDFVLRVEALPTAA